MKDYAPYTKNNSIPRKCLYCVSQAVDGSRLCEACLKNKNLKKYSGRLPRTKRTNSKNRKPSNPLYNTAKWKKFRLIYLSAHPLCEGCAAARQASPAVALDHIVPLSHLDRVSGSYYNGNGKLDKTNVQGLCLRHHGIKNREEKKNIAIDWKNNRKIVLI